MDIYERLAERLDHYAVGFPRTSSGIELRILKRLFTPQEAELYLQLTLTLETPERIAQRIERPP
ncbi:MAG: 4Fe-4S ferredoxin, partial [Desulfatiglandales bacterium]